MSAGTAPGDIAKAFAAGADFVMLGGLRSTCTYVGANSLKELSKRTTFVAVSQQLNEVFGSS